MFRSLYLVVPNSNFVTLVPSGGIQEFMGATCSVRWSDEVLKCQRAMLKPLAFHNRPPVLSMQAILSDARPSFPRILLHIISITMSNADFAPNFRNERASRQRAIEKRIPYCLILGELKSRTLSTCDIVDEIVAASGQNLSLWLDYLQLQTYFKSHFSTTTRTLSDQCSQSRDGSRCKERRSPS